MTQPTYMTQFRLFWEAADAVRARRGLPPLNYETAFRWFECAIEPADVPAVLGSEPSAVEASTITRVSAPVDEDGYLRRLLERTKKAREAKGWTQDFVASSLGIPLERYKKYEKRTPLPLYLVERLCTLTGTNLHFFVTGKKP